ncbi:MAG TPA: ABC transporter ATP-binding protein [Thermoanaerobaculia bacterium]|nr:ABC transporter ATP-binding protein [Thermoanaerobaculia bacterium]
MSEHLHEEEALGKVYDADLLRRLWPFMRPYRGQVLFSLSLIPLRAALEVLPPLLIGAALDFLTLGEIRSELPWLTPLLRPPEGAAVSQLFWLFALILAVSAGLLGLEWLRGWSMLVLGQKTIADVRRRLFDHVQRLPLRFFDRYPVGRLVTRLTNDLENLAEMFSMGIVALIADVFVMLFFAYVVFTIDARLALAAMGIVPVLAVAALVFRYKVREAFREVRVKIARLNAHLQETISGMKVVQLFARERRNLADFERMNASHRDSWRRSIGYDALLFSSVDLATNLTRAVIFWYGARLLLRGEITLGTIYVFTDYMARFFRPLMDLSAKYSVMQSSMASAERVFQLFDETPERTFGGDPLPTPARGEVVFDRVSFSYGAEPILKDVSFRVAPGERVALVGHTGAGKTTVLKLLARLYQPQSGTISIDGRDVRDLDAADLRRQMAFVLQDVFLFDGDLRHNVVLGAADVTDEDLAAAVDATHVRRLVDRLPERFAQKVKERGVNFSAGERQLLSFARALVRRPALLLLDEATSNVDTETEGLVQDALHRLMEGKTCIVVAHRLSTIRDVDRIYVMHHGEIVEQGTHQELLAQRGVYWRLYQLQFAQQEGAAA